MAAVQNNGCAIEYASEEIREELEKGAKSFDITVQQYAAAAAHSKVIQLFVSDRSDVRGYGGGCLNISCLDMCGEEVLTFPLNEDADNAHKLRNELAKTQGVSPAALQI